ncbi:MAG: hypothetical protein IJQ39_15230 [Thermoguttaceae bacterium]|nr:hypothetical protein [Thermoguttaceae bacterium]
MNKSASKTMNRSDLYQVWYKSQFLICGTVRLLICLFAVFATINSSALAQLQEGFPYMAKVSVQNAAARSGPGMSYYATQPLPVGSVVEVYCELPTGWAAIRPPQGSFSWVRGKFLEVKSDGTGRITDDNTASGVGSDLQDSRDVVQVRMRKDELVEIIQKTNIGSEEWYRISPPSGEFRWVNLNDILPDDPLRRTPQQTQRSQNPSSTAVSFVPAVGPNIPPMPSGPYGPPPVPGPRHPQGLSDEEFYRELTDLERAWSAMFHTQPANWHSAQLLYRARFLKTQANSERKLTRVDLLISRLEKANQMEIAAGVPQPGMMHRPYGPHGAPANPLLDPKTLPPGSRATVLPGLESTQAEFNRAGNEVMNLPAPPGASPYDQLAQRNIEMLTKAEELEKNMRLDGVGLLAPLPQGTVDRLPIRWALLDVNGQVRYYVSPALGVYFKGMEGRVVGVVGSREYLPNNDQHIHITVRHIRPL